MSVAPGAGRIVEVGRSTLPALKLNYYLTNPETGRLEHHCQTPSGDRFVSVIEDRQLISLFECLAHHMTTRFPPKVQR